MYLHMVDLVRPLCHLMFRMLITKQGNQLYSALSHSFGSDVLEMREDFRFRCQVSLWRLQAPAALAGSELFVWLMQSNKI